MSIPAFNNPPIHPEWYQPSVFPISSITTGLTTIVVTSDDTMNYTIGQLIKLIIPYPYGSQQLNNLYAYVISLPSENSVEIDVDSRFVNPYLTPSVVSTVPQIIAVGSVNSGPINTNGITDQITSIPGSFINISPSSVT